MYMEPCIWWPIEAEIASAPRRKAGESRTAAHLAALLLHRSAAAVKDLHASLAMPGERVAVAVVVVAGVAGVARVGIIL